MYSLKCLNRKQKNDLKIINLVSNLWIEKKDCKIKSQKLEGKKEYKCWQKSRK